MSNSFEIDVFCGEVLLFVLACHSVLNFDFYRSYAQVFDANFRNRFPLPM